MNLDIFQRCHTRVLGEKRNRPWPLVKAPRFSRYLLVLDTETTRDSRQKLNFGVYWFCELESSGNYAIREEGLFYADDLDSQQQAVLRKYVETENQQSLRHGGPKLKLKLYDRSAFVEKVLYAAIQANAAIVAFNLPFDISRLAVEYRVARVAGGQGWSFVLFRYRDKKKRKWLPNSFRPRVQLRPKDSKSAFMESEPRRRVPRVQGSGKTRPRSNWTRHPKGKSTIADRT